LHHKGAPILGDPIYGKPSKNSALPERLMLHAWKLSFEHPITGVRHHFESPIPAEFEPWMEKFRARGH
jgi:23S rRNA pseudouridine1911/1915/1917 synthase